MDYAFKWIHDNGGLCTEQAYPYTGQQGPCKADLCQVVQGSGVKGYSDLKSSETALMTALNKGPVSVAIQANQFHFQLYQSGVMSGRCGTNLDHGVLAVGYGSTMEGQNWWKVKNR